MVKESNEHNNTLQIKKDAKVNHDQHQTNNKSIFHRKSTMQLASSTQQCSEGVKKNTKNQFTFEEQHVKEITKQRTQFQLEISNPTANDEWHRIDTWLLRIKPLIPIRRQQVRIMRERHRKY